NTLGEAPVLSQDLNPQLNVQSMLALLENEGYFNSRIAVDTVSEERKIRLRYEVAVERPYVISSVSWRLDSSQLATYLRQLSAEGSVLLPGDRYTVEKIKAEKERLAQGLKEKGYYYFEAEHLLSYIDTNFQNYTAAIFMTINRPLPENAGRPYTLKQIVVKTPFTSFSPMPDSLVKILPLQDGIYIDDSSHKFKPDLFSRTISFRPGTVYSLSEQNRIQARLNSLGAFRFIKPQFTQAAAGVGLMNVTYYMAPYQKRKMQAEVGGFTRSNSYTGGQVSIQWSDKNIFKRAENLAIKATGSFEVTPNDSLKYNNNWRVGIEPTLTIPKLVVPFSFGQQKATYAKTVFPLSFDWVRHQDLYTEKYFHSRYELIWRDTLKREYRLTPFSLTISNTANFTNGFELRQQADSLLK
ncbi:MAG TPA: hypothetical protein VFL47_05440, partial [Flavisolibacter sp.]|nr:hypothetical protein [Flavisolibacter sp.]